MWYTHICVGVAWLRGISDNFSYRGHIIPPGVSAISLSKLFWKCAASDITGGRVHLDVFLDRSVHQPTQWTVANVARLSIIHLGGHAHLWCHKSQNFKTNGKWLITLTLGGIICHF